MVILLPLGAAFKRRGECRESVDLGFGECIGRWHVIGAVATLGQLDVHAGRFRRHRGELHHRSAEAIWLSSSCSPCDFITRNSCSMTQRRWDRRPFPMQPRRQRSYVWSAASNAVLRSLRWIDFLHVDQPQLRTVGCTGWTPRSRPNRC